MSKTTAIALILWLALCACVAAEEVDAYKQRYEQYSAHLHPLHPGMVSVSGHLLTQDDRTLELVGIKNLNTRTYRQDAQYGLDFLLAKNRVIFYDINRIKHLIVEKYVDNLANTQDVPEKAKPYVVNFWEVSVKFTSRLLKNHVRLAHFNREIADTSMFPLFVVTDKEADGGVREYPIDQVREIVLGEAPEYIFITKRPPLKKGFDPGRFPYSTGKAQTVTDIKQQVQDDLDTDGQHAPSGQAVLKIHASRHPQARIYIDGKFCGNPPLTLRLDAGPHSVRVLSGETVLLEEELTLFAQSEQSLNVDNES